ncbi:VOC family protein [Merismopedia glauca]|uniref:Glyoxalase n=1 Tax=Merismopedia glauca CCAP 1448/3 TaxID=1296344 RepID=A0A2T1C847_9CYAN|nr:VOC family protein [Merismopedia glauca]PSB04419.1 glyoxalase [Merismopedia glauca CCAP 1448/3]
MNEQVIFHLAFPITDISKAKEFYADGLGAEVGRESQDAVIFNFYGNQIVAHVTREPINPQKGIYPRHFGLVFNSLVDWETMLDRAKTHNLNFYQQPKHRFPNLPIEHRTFFLIDPFSNILEFKFYSQSSAIFGEHNSTQIGDIVAHK